MSGAANAMTSWSLDRLPSTAILALLLAVGCTGTEGPAPAQPHRPAQPFEAELWPGEGRPRFAARGTTLAVHERPVASSATTTVAVDPGRDLAWDESLVRTVRPGIVMVEEPFAVSARPLGRTSLLSREGYYDDGTATRSLTLPTGPLEHLQVRAEGTCFVRLEDVVYEVQSCPWIGAAAGPWFAVESEPATEWWLRLTGEGGAALGWLLVDPEVVRPLPRTF